MLKTALMFAGSALVLAMFAPDLIATLAPGPAPAPAPRLAAPAPAVVQRAAVRPAASEHEVAIQADSFGQFSADAQVNGQSVHMLIDTGASFVSLSANAAERLGVTIPANAPKVRVHTANGDAVATQVQLDALQIGPVYLPDVTALIVDRSAGEVNLVGMSFLRRLASVEQRNGALYLRQ